MRLNKDNNLQPLNLQKMYLPSYIAYKLPAIRLLGYSHHIPNALNLRISILNVSIHKLQ